MAGTRRGGGDGVCTREGGGVVVRSVETHGEIKWALVAVVTIILVVALICCVKTVLN